MKKPDLIKQLANRINQPHVIESWIEKIERAAYKKGYADAQKEQCNIANVVKSLPNDEKVKAHIDTLPYYGTCTTEYNEGFEDGVKWLKEQLAKWGYVLQRFGYEALPIQKRF